MSPIAAITRRTRRLYRRRMPAVGAAPGEMVVAQDAHPTSMRIIAYDADRLVEKDSATLADADRLAAQGLVVWIDVQGLADMDLIRDIGRRFNVHHLALADAVNVGQRPKMDAYDDHMFIAVRMVTVEQQNSLQWEQVGVLKGEGWVVTFQERPGDCLEPLRERIRAGRVTLRRSRADYLAAMIVDAIVDGYFPVLEAFGERLEDLEERSIRGSTDESVLEEIYKSRRDLMTFRRAVWPLRESLLRLQHDASEHFSEPVLPYLRDTLDHTMQVVDVVESYREIAGSLVEVYLSMVGHRTNEVMRVLTVLASIFIPLTFFAGIYGMNFEHIPELHLRYGYYIFWAFSVVTAVTLLIVFRRLGWLGGRQRR